jgi:hypothetical protein
MFKKIIVFLVITGLLGELWQWMNEWQLHEMPYQFIAGFYHFTFQEVIRFFPKIWNFIHYSSITPFENLNWILGFIVMLLALLFFYQCFYNFNTYMVKNGVSKKVYVGYFIPLISAATIYLASGFLGWLFQ